MIGREGERSRVGLFLDGAGAGVHVLLLHGEPGIGKTTLWRDALDAARRGGRRVVTTRPSEAEAKLPFGGLSDLLGELMPLAIALPAPQRAALDAALARGVTPDEPVQPLALSLAGLELIRLAASERPVTVAIDDVQWLDESSIAILRFALRRIEREPVTVIATMRASERDPSPALFADLAQHQVTQLRVGPLGADAIDRLLDTTLGLRLRPTTLREVERTSGGNPFFAVEIGRALQAHSPDRLGDALPLPESLTSLLRRRLHALPDDARAVVAHAAALSQPTTAQLEAALGHDVAEAGLRAAREAQIVVPDAEPLTFTHPLLASEAYAGLAGSDRRGMHRRLAGITSEPQERARHLALAAAGPDPEVAEALDAAAATARESGAPAGAAELGVLAAGLTANTDPARAHRLADAGRDRLMAGDVGRARDLLEQALEEPGARTGPARGELLLRLAGVRQLMDDPAAAESLARQALRHAGADESLRVQIKLLLAGIAYVTGRGWAAGARHAFDANRIAEGSGDARLRASTIGPYVTWRQATGRTVDPDIGKAVAALEPWTRTFRTLDLPDWDLAAIDFAEGRTTAWSGRLRVLVARAEHDGDYSSLPYLLAAAALDDFLAGRGDDARDRIGRATRLAEATGQHIGQVHVHAYAVRLEARLGNVDRAGVASSAVFELMHTTKWAAGAWPMRSDLALLELSRGDPEAALAHVIGAVEPATDDESGRWRAGLPAAVEALVALGRLDEARAALERQRSRTSGRLRAELLRARGRLLSAAGDQAGADAAIGVALTSVEAMDDRWETARTALAAGEVHRRARRRALARAAFREALEGFAFLGSGLWAKHARDQIARLDAAHDPGALTPTQQRVAELAAEGLTNRAIASRLFMSPHTVEAHLSAIYRALGISSRGGLAAALASESAEVRDSDAGSRDSASS